MEKRHLGEHVFTDDDQRRFAQVSGDRNPMHMDRMVARRLMSGRPVVHGIHVLLTLIERAGDGNWRDASVSCRFENPVSVGERVTFLQHEDALGHVVFEAVVDGVACTRAVLARRTGTTSETAPAELLPGDRLQPDDVTPAADGPPEQFVGKRYSISLQNGLAGETFPMARRIVGANAVSALAAMSYFVGMVCPGLHSMLSAIKFDLLERDAAEGSLRIAVQKYHSSVRLLDIAFAGPIQGQLQAFRRHPPQPQPSSGELAALVDGREFLGTRSLIVGGSRGLGELTAKLVAAGGGDVVITYLSGHDDASRVSHEINAAGGGSCQAMAFDILRDPWDRLTNADQPFDAIYFFPTPRIFRKTARTFAADRFQHFCDFYATAFFAMCAAVEQHATRPVRIFFPSSIAVADRPKGLTEYAMAKAAAEILVEDINRSFTHVSVTASRLPRLSTDQTLTVLDVPAESNAGTLLPIVRSMYRRANPSVA
jgi:hypothetical protein